MKLITKPLLKSLVAMAVLGGACASALAGELPKRAEVPTQNFSRVTGVGAYVAEHASDAQYAMFKRYSGLAVFAQSYLFGKEGSYRCVAIVGLTHEYGGDTDMPRSPFTIYSGGASDPKNTEDLCRSVAVVRALNNMLQADVQAWQDKVTQTMPTGGERVKEQSNEGMIRSSWHGMSAKGSAYIRDALPNWFGRAFDYRVVTVAERFLRVEGDNDQLICFASLGLTATAPSGRSAKLPWANSARVITLNKDERGNADQDSACFDPLFDALVKENIQPDSDFISFFVKNWSLVAEPGLKAPTMKDVQTAAARQAERDRKAAAAREREEARPVRVAQANSCTTSCVNGSCVRRWANGRSERFQAPRKFNPFTSQWEWDTSGC
jgi:hypothetical protein